MLADVHPRVAALNRLSASTLFAATFVGYVLLATSAYELFGALSIGVTFFPPAGLTFASLLVLDLRRWPVVVGAIVAGEVAVDLAHGQGLAWSLGWALANSAEPVVGALVARSMTRDIGLSRKFAGGFAVGGLLTGPAVGASIGATVLLIANDLNWVEVWIDVWVGDALGVLVVGPAVVLAMLPSRFMVQPSRRLVVGASVAVVLLGAAFFSVDRVFVGYMAIPLLGWAALSLGARGLAAVSVAVASVSTASTAHGRGPFFAIADGDHHDRLSSQQFFLLMAIGGAWLLALEVRRRLIAVEQETSARAELDRARVRAELVDELQRSFVPPRSIRNDLVEVAGYYQAASADLDIGGDWYDLFEHAGGVDLVVGDVVGHGVRSAAAMGRLSSAARAIGPQALDPSQAMTRLDHLADDVPDAQCSTVIWARYHPTTGRFECCRAGHPPAIVRSPDGEVTILDDPPGRPLGCNSPARTHATIELPAGSLVLMYTDGLVDWRLRRGGGDALGELAAIVRDAPLLDPPELVEHVVKAALDGVDALDDVAVVCMSLR